MAAATATTRSLNECVGFDVSVLTNSSQRRPSSSASRGAGSSGELPTGRPRAGVSTGRNAAQRHSVARPLGDRLAADRGGDRLHVVGGLQRAEAAIAGEAGVERVFSAAALADEMGGVHRDPSVRASDEAGSTSSGAWAPPGLAPFPPARGKVAEASQGRSLRLSRCDCRGITPTNSALPGHMVGNDGRGRQTACGTVASGCALLGLAADRDSDQRGQAGVRLPSAHSPNVMPGARSPR